MIDGRVKIIVHLYYIEYWIRSILFLRTCISHRTVTKIVQPRRVQLMVYNKLTYRD